MSAEALLIDWQRRHAAWDSKVRELQISGKESARLAKLLTKEPKLKKVGEGCAGLWRSKTKKRPAMMTDYIRSEGLLPAAEIATLRARAPKEIIDNQQKFANGESFLEWHDFLEMFSPEDALDEISGGACNGCRAV